MTARVTLTWSSDLGHEPPALPIYDGDGRVRVHDPDSGLVGWARLDVAWDDQLPPASG